MGLETTVQWKQALHDVIEQGALVEPGSAGASWRGRTTRELIAYQTCVPMARPVVCSPARELGARFLAAEAAWILSGDNRVDTIAPFARNIAKFSDDGARFFGAYGPRFVDQLPHVLRTLAADPRSRQAVIEVWRPSPPDSRDTPCTLSWQFLCRAGRLDLVATMRSSDLWTGWVYDVFNFSMIAAGVLLELRRTDGGRNPWRDVGLGLLHLTAGSQHLYRIDDAVAEKVLAEPAAPDCFVEPELRVDGFGSLDDLAAHLWARARDPAATVGGVFERVGGLAAADAS